MLYFLDLELLPTPLLVVEERTVGPDLGEDSIKSGTISLIVGFILVILFMFYKYKIFGLIANTALIANLLMLMGILTILEATLNITWNSRDYFNSWYGS